MMRTRFVHQHVMKLDVYTVAAGSDEGQVSTLWFHGGSGHDSVSFLFCGEGHQKAMINPAFTLP